MPYMTISLVYVPEHDAVEPYILRYHPVTATAK